MKTYTTLFAIDVPHYGCHDIEAEDDQAAIAAAEALHKADGVTYYDPSWEYATCARIVHIEDPDGKIIVNDKALDNHFLRSGGEADKLLCDHAANLLYALKQIAESLSGASPLKTRKSRTPSPRPVSMTWKMTNTRPAATQSTTSCVMLWRRRGW